MKLHGAFEILPRHVPKRTNFNNPRVINQNVDFAKATDDLTNRGSSLRGIEQVALNGQNRAAARSEIGLCTRQFFRVARNERNAPALRANMSRKHKPQPAGSAGDHGDFVAQRITRGANGASRYPSAE